MDFVRTFTAEEKLLIMSDVGVPIDAFINNAIDQMIRQRRKNVEPVAVQMVLDGKIAAPTVLSHDEVLKAYLSSGEFKTAREQDAEREIEHADAAAVQLQVEIDIEEDVDKKAEKQSVKDDLDVRKLAHRDDLDAARSIKAGLLAEL